MSVLVDFRCENCHEMQFDVTVEPDAIVTCPQCEHTVDVGVYVGTYDLAELMEERDPPLRPKKFYNVFGKEVPRDSK